MPRTTHVLAACTFCLTSLAVYASGPDPKIAEGKYLVEEVAKCQDCHTPMTPKGPDSAKWLKGAPLPFSPLQPVPGWAKITPDLTSSGALFKQWGEKGLKQFLTKGVDPAGNPAQPPMPAYRLREHDADAVIAYLKSLK